MKKRMSKWFVTAILAAMVVGSNTAYADETAADQNVEEQVEEQAAEQKSDEAPVRVDSVKREKMDR